MLIAILQSSFSMQQSCNMAEVNRNEFDYPTALSFMVSATENFVEQQKKGLKQLQGQWIPRDMSGMFNEVRGSFSLSLNNLALLIKGEGFLGMRKLFSEKQFEELKAECQH